jgi:hypothetical protein
VKDCDLIFLDPDNGLEVPSVAPHHKLGPKYASFAELQAFASLNGVKSVVVYQHICRNGCAADQITRWIAQIKSRLETERAILPVVYRRATQRVFFIIPSNPERGWALRSRVEQMLREPWSQHFSLLEV